MSESVKEPKGVRFHYLKSPAFSTLHADGVIGGLTPRGDVHVAFYAERLPIPQETFHTLNEDGTLGPEQREQRVCRDGVVREMLVDVTMDIFTAQRIYEWFRIHLELARKRADEAEAAASVAESEKKA